MSLRYLFRSAPCLSTVLVNECVGSTAPLQQPPLPDRHFRDLDDEGTNLMSSLHLDAEDEPRRGLGATSRANSVRFDETANQNHFSHSTRPSAEFMSRTSSGLGGLQMTERTASHKSEGRASSQHSIRSAASGRASSLNLDSAYGLAEASRSPFDAAGLAPGLLLLGSVPAIIRCWMNTNFKHNALLYAAVCTGSYKSFLDLRLIQKLGFEDKITTSAEGERTVELPVYFPEAVPHPASSRSSSPAPQLPTVAVDFQVVDHKASLEEDKAIQIFLGSDVLRAHSADILFSSNSMTLLDDDRSKLSIPLVRPEDEAAFNRLFITSSAGPTATEQDEEDAKEESYFNGVGQESSTASISSTAASPPPGKYTKPSTTEPSSSSHAIDATDPNPRPLSRQSNLSRPSLGLLSTTRSEAPEFPTAAAADQPATHPTPSRSGSSPAIWSNWRRDGGSTASSATAGATPTGMDWAGASRNRDASYQRKDTGIKVLKPKTAAAASRAFSSSAAQAAGSAGGSNGGGGEGKSRFFDEGRRRGSDGEGEGGISSPAVGASSSSSSAVAAPTAGVPAAPVPKTKSNPIGGGSAFSWLNAGGGGK